MNPTEPPRQPAPVASGGWAARSAWSVCDNLVQQGLAFLIFAMLARWLSPHEFGLLAIAHLMVLFVRMSLFDAMAMPVVRAPAVDDSLYNALFTLTTCVAVAMACLMAALAVPAAAFFGANDLVPVLWGMSLSVVLFGLVRAHEARLLREANFRLLAIRSLCAVSAGGIVALVLAWRGAGAMALVAQQLVTGAVALVIAVAAEWRRWRPRWVWPAALVRSHAGEMRRVGVNSLVSYANQNGDAALISVLFGPHATGLYNLAKRVLSAAFLVIASSLSRVGVSLFVERQGEPAALGQSYVRMLGWMLLLLVPVYAVAALLAEPLVVLVFGERWRASAPLFGWLSVALVAQAGFLLGQNLSFATRHSARVLRLSIVQLGMAAAGALALSSHGMKGVAAGFALGSVAACVLMQVAVRRQLGLRWAVLLRPMLPALGGAAGVALVHHGWPAMGEYASRWLGLALALGAGLLSYAALAAAVHWVVRRYAVP